MIRKSNTFYLIIYGGKVVEGIVNLSIFDRWGEQVFGLKNFQPNDSSFGWSGSFNGIKMNSQVFIYITEVEFLHGEKRIYSGDITLLK